MGSIDFIRHHLFFFFQYKDTQSFYSSYKSSVSLTRCMQSVCVINAIRMCHRCNLLSVSLSRALSVYAISMCHRSSQYVSSMQSVCVIDSFFLSSLLYFYLLVSLMYVVVNSEVTGIKIKIFAWFFFSNFKWRGNRVAEKVKRIVGYDF